jgi:hypothetical protein
MGAETVGESSTGQGLFKRCLTNPALFTVNAEVDMPIFIVTLSEMEKAYENATKEPKNEIVPENIKAIYSNPDNVPPQVLNEVIELFDTVSSLDEFYTKASELINEYN